jgi:hypothetical protein
LNKATLCAAADLQQTSVGDGAFKRRRGSTIARVAVMRKLATIIWHMLSKGKTYAKCRELAAAGKA